MVLVPRHRAVGGGPGASLSQAGLPAGPHIPARASQPTDQLAFQPAHQPAHEQARQSARRRQPTPSRGVRVGPAALKMTRSLALLVGSLNIGFGGALILSTAPLSIYNARYVREESLAVANFLDYGIYYFRQDAPARRSPKLNFQYQKTKRRCTLIKNSFGTHDLLKGHSNTLHNFCKQGKEVVLNVNLAAHYPATMTIQLRRA